MPKTTGILLHPSSLPNNQHCGSFGSSAREWVKMLANNGIGIWQFLPLSPPDNTGSPYSSPSSFALNPWFLDANDLIEEGFIKCKSYSLKVSAKKLNRVDFNEADLQANEISRLLMQYWPEQTSQSHLEFNNWCKNQHWLEDHSSFIELKRQFKGLAWWEWPKPFASNDTNEVKAWKMENREKLLEHYLVQWHLDKQWQRIRKLSRSLGVILFGDLPFYVARDSADTWGNRNLFSILPNGELDIQSGVPPDYFSDNGQLWGTPVYKWEQHKQDNYSWWRARVRRQYYLIDIIRIDHFRGLESFWSVPGKSKVAQGGRWEKSPGELILSLIKQDFDGQLPLVAEDLGVITPEVETLRDNFNLPGMKVLQFAFNGDNKNPYLPENIHGNNWVLYAGTHDNATSISWWEALEEESKRQVEMEIKGNVTSPGLQILELGLKSEACLVIATIQDLLELDDIARFNKPGTIGNNWRWRLESFDLNLKKAISKFGKKEY